MTDKPIIFSAPMVRALLDGRKTQTRRVLRPQPDPGRFFGHMTYVPEQRKIIVRNCNHGLRQDIPVPHAIGDRLWVREGWSGTYAFRDTPPSQRCSFAGEGVPFFREEIWYWADGSPEYGDWEKPRPSIHMPRWASRLTLTVTDVRAQRVQDISETDAAAEGADHRTERGKAEIPGLTAKAQFEAIWDDINGERGFGWDANPWVVALTFDVHRRNIDQMEPC